jgi:hypothetical protein
LFHAVIYFPNILQRARAVLATVKDGEDLYVKPSGLAFVVFYLRSGRRLGGVLLQSGVRNKMLAMMT